MAQQYFKTILVGIEYPHERRQLALNRATQWAMRAPARLILFHSAYSPYTVGPKIYLSVLEKGVDKVLAERHAALEKLAAPLRRRGLKVTVKATYDYPPFEGIVREVLRSKPDLVVTESRRHALGARLFLTNTDWQLIRLCPAPLLFVKQTRPYRQARVMAAIDPLHGSSKSAGLDARILDAAQAVAATHSGRVDAVHAYLPLKTYVPSFGDVGIAVIDPKVEAQRERHTQRELERTVAGIALPRNRLHVIQGSAHAVLPGFARRLRADVLVMGALSRRGLERLFIGNTAEHTIDRVPCDVLVVKPRGFKTPVPRRSALTQLSLPMV